MPLFISSTSTAHAHGVYAIKRTPPTQIRASGTGTVAIVGQFPWGPVGTIFSPADLADAKSTMAPLGTTRTGYAYLMLLAMAFPDLRLVRVVGNATAAAASAVLADVTPTNIVTIPAKYMGTEGNNFVAVVSTASDGVSGHFNLDVTVTNSAGSTTDSLKNLNYSGTGADTVLTAAQLNQLRLIGQPVKSNSGRPLNGTYTFSGGITGTVGSSDYIGTAGSSDKGIALLEGDKSVDHVVCDYPGSSLLAAVNAGLVAHQVLMGDRSVYLNDKPSQTASHSQSDVASYRGAGVVYVDPWAYIYDDTTGIEQLVPPGVFAAGLAAQLSPSTSFAWKATEVQKALGAITRLEAARGLGAPTNTDNGISTLIREDTGGHTFEAAVNTIAATDPTQVDHTATRMDIYIAKAFSTSVRGSVDGPNVDLNREDIRTAVSAFMGTLKNNAKTDPNHKPHVLDYTLPPLSSANTSYDYANGDVYFPLNVQYSTGIKRLFFVMKSGTLDLPPVNNG